MSPCDALSLRAAECAMFGGSGGAGAGYSGGDCADGYGLGYVAGGGRLQQYAAHFAPHQNVWHHHHPTHHDTYGELNTKERTYPDVIQHAAITMKTYLEQ